jgi:hypothetical protein
LDGFNILSNSLLKHWKLVIPSIALIGLAMYFLIIGLSGLLFGFQIIPLAAQIYFIFLNGSLSAAYYFDVLIGAILLIIEIEIVRVTRRYSKRRTDPFEHSYPKSVPKSENAPQ